MSSECCAVLILGMPARIQWEEDSFILVYSGVVKLSEVFDMYDQLSGSSRYEYAQYGLIDCREVADVDYEEKHYKKHAAYAKAVGDHLKVKTFRMGVVMGNDRCREILKNFSKHTQQFSEVWERKFFDNYEDAKAWAMGADSCSSPAAS